MTPYGRAYLAFAACDGDMTFDEVVMEHFDHGYVFSTPTMFALVRAVPWPVPDAAWMHPQIRWEPKDCNCWYVHLFAGDLHELIDQRMPSNIGYVAWHSRHHRKTRLHSASVERIRNLHELGRF